MKIFELQPSLPHPIFIVTFGCLGNEKALSYFWIILESLALYLSIKSYKKENQLLLEKIKKTILARMLALQA